MEKRLCILMLLSGVELILTLPHKYYLIQQQKMWTDAQTYCRTYYKDLATIESDADIIKLQSEAQKQQFKSSTWIGLYNDIKSWRWSIGNEPLGTPTMWEPGQPDNAKSAESCVLTTLGTWWDTSCLLLRRFVCFDGNKTGNDRFVYYTVTVTWFEALDYCRKFHTDLSIIRDVNEASFINQLTKGWGVWIGLFRDTWKWSDQTNSTFIRWATKQPNNAMGNENCCIINNGLAEDVPCSGLQPFYCYRVITGQKQILRFKIQSDQDLNDSTQKAVILDKIQQKLIQGGMTMGIRVIFREQPNGVFHKLGKSSMDNAANKCTTDYF